MSTQEDNFKHAADLAVKNHEAQVKADKDAEVKEDKDAKTEIKAQPKVTESKNPEQVKVTDK